MKRVLFLTLIAMTSLIAGLMTGMAQGSVEARQDRRPAIDGPATDEPVGENAYLYR